MANEEKREPWMDTDEFVKMMKGFIKRYKHDVKENKSSRPIKEWKDEEFKMWHIIKDAYDRGFSQAYDYWRDTLFELTDAENHFREQISKEVY